MFERLFEKKYEMSLSKIILLFYILASSTALFPLLSKQLKTVLEENRIAQHILGITTMLALIILISDGKFSTQRIIMYTTIGYIWFVFSTKLELQWNIIIIGALAVFILYQDMTKHKDIKIQDDKNIEEAKKEYLQKNNKEYYIYITIALILLTIGGTMLYSNKKVEQYGGKYDLTNFLVW